MADMETRGLFCLGSVLLLLVLNYATAQEIPSYFKVGGELTLDPGPFDKELTNILWKNNGSLVADWVKDKVDLKFYKTYEGRTQLDLTTGVLTISNMKNEDAGPFTVEINSQVLGKTFRAEAVVELEEPSIWISPLTCGSSTEPCTLTCETNTSQAGPVSYVWKSGNQVLPQKTREWVITKAEVKRFKTFTCLVKNPVSERESKPKDNPLYQEKPPADHHGVDGPMVARLVIAIVVPVLVVLALLYRKRDDILKRFSKIRGHPDPESPTYENLEPFISKLLFSVGGHMSMEPNPPVSEPITKILWKHDGHLVAEWVEGPGPARYYGSFDGRTTLDVTTGCLEIRDMSAVDSGTYTVEINDRIQDHPYVAELH